MQTDWVVYSKSCVNRTDSIIGYLARYTHRIAISDQRIIALDKDRVHFRYKDYRDDQSKIMALRYDEFIRRFLMHVLPKGLMRVRHYGILANRCRKASLNIIRRILASPAQIKPAESSNEPVTYPCPQCRKGQLKPKSRIIPPGTCRHPLPS